MFRLYKMAILALGAVTASTAFFACAANNNQTEFIAGVVNKNSKTESVAEEYNIYKDFEYNNGDDGNISITRYLGEESSVKVPSYINGLPVSAISSHCFQNEDNPHAVKSVAIPSTVSSVSALAFYKSKYLQKIICEKNGSYADSNGVLYTADFANLVAYPENRQNKEFIMPDTVTTIYCNAFSYCDNIERVVLSPMLEVIPDYAFSENASLKEVQAQHNIKSVGYAAFNKCKSLMKISLPSSVIKINEQAVIECDKLECIEAAGSNDCIMEFADSLGVSYKSLYN